MNRLKLNEGCNMIDGEESILLSKYEENRFDHNMILASSIIDEMFDFNNLVRFNEILNRFGNVIDTDLSKDVMTSLIYSKFQNQKWEVRKQSIDGVVSKEKVVLSSLEDDVVLLDSSSIRDASLKIQDTLK